MQNSVSSVCQYYGLQGCWTGRSFWLFFFRNSHRNVNFKRFYPNVVFICFLITNAKRYYVVPLQFFYLSYQDLGTLFVYYYSANMCLYF